MDFGLKSERLKGGKFEEKNEAAMCLSNMANPFTQSDTLKVILARTTFYGWPANSSGQVYHARNAWVLSPIPI